MVNHGANLENRHHNSREVNMLARHFFQKSIASTLLVCLGFAAQAQSGPMSTSTGGNIQPAAEKYSNMTIDCDSFFSGKGIGELYSKTGNDSLDCNTSTTTGVYSNDVRQTDTEISVAISARTTIRSNTTGEIQQPGFGDLSSTQLAAQVPVFFKVDRAFTALISMNKLVQDGWMNFELTGTNPTFTNIRGQDVQTGYTGNKKFLDGYGLSGLRGDQNGNGQTTIDLPAGEYQLLVIAQSRVSSSSRVFDSLASGTVTIQAIPEPSSWALMGLGLVGLTGAARLRRRATTH